MSEWRTTNLGSVVTLQRGFDLPSRLRRRGPVPIVSSSGTSGWHDRAMVKAPGVVTGRYGTIGEVFFECADFWPLNTTLWVSDFHGNDERFVYYLLQRLDFAAHSGKSGVPGVNRNDLHAEPVSLPVSVDEQRAIADALSDCDALIEQLERVIAKKQAVKQGIAQRLLTGLTRLPGFTSGAWEPQPLRQGATLISGNHVMAKDCNTQGVGTPYLTGPADFPHGRIRQTKFTTRPGALCRAGDILVTVKGSGSGSMVEADSEYCISRQLMAVRPSEWDSRFLFYSLLHHASHIKAASTGLIPGLSRSDILDQLLPVPPTVEEQRAVAATLTAIDQQVENLERAVAKKEALKKGMMQELLTGRTRLPIQGEETA
ncbi:restriction endonuclease subunit S [Streptomyces sp. NPDC041003]|uniref:restriction endonuclease subunit S n=1 Tax=Streptomyces sp. NPDC041003 TaxID=3155730 RepID=UPI0033E3E4F0